MSIINLRCSEIRFTQDSISAKFTKGGKIGELLDDIILGYITVGDIPKINVCFLEGAWWSLDNRRLWVLKKAEQFGKCDNIDVMKKYAYKGHKFTTLNEGKDIKVRGHPGGSYWIDNMNKMKTVVSYDVYLSECRYSKSEIPGEWNYKLNLYVGDILDMIINRVVKKEELLPLDVVVYKDNFYSLCNEKLWVLKKCLDIGFILSSTKVTVAVKMNISENENIFKSIFNLQSQGKLITIRTMGRPIRRNYTKFACHSTSLQNAVYSKPIYRPNSVGSINSTKSSYRRYSALYGQPSSVIYPLESTVNRNSAMPNNRSCSDLYKNTSSLTCRDLESWRMNGYGNALRNTHGEYLSRNSSTRIPEWRRPALRCRVESCNTDNIFDKWKENPVTMRKVEQQENSLCHWLFIAVIVFLVLIFIINFP